MSNEKQVTTESEQSVVSGVLPDLEPFEGGVFPDLDAPTDDSTSDDSEDDSDDDSDES